MSFIQSCNMELGSWCNYAHAYNFYIFLPCLITKKITSFFYKIKLTIKKGISSVIFKIKIITLKNKINMLRTYN